MVTYDPRTALIVVDMQNDFADPDGSLYVTGGEQIIDTVDAEIDRAAKAGAPIIYTQDWHPEHTPHFAKDGGIWPDHCIRDSWGAEFHLGLTVAGPVLRKGADGRDGYSGFSVRDPESGETSQTALEQMLRDRDVRRLVVCGLATDYCVVETVCDARMLGFPVEVLTNAIRAVNLQPDDGEKALQRMLDAGAEPT